MKKCWKEQKQEVETERKIKANDTEYNASFEYANNYITTSKYNLLTFIPKNLFEQFQRLANAYFMGLLILQLIPQISSLTPLTTIIPLAAVLCLTGIKDAIDDIQRHRSDNQVNNRHSLVMRKGDLVEELWHKVNVGDIIKMENDQFVAADLLLLSTSEPNSLCYIETAELDGETNLKVRQALTDTAELGTDLSELSKFDGEVICEPPNNRLSRFEGILKYNNQTYSLDNDKMLLRGCVLRNTRWCYGLVVFAGKDTKLMMNTGKSIFKRTHIDRLVNTLIIGIFMFLLCSCLICSICSFVWEYMVGFHFQRYLRWEDFIALDRANGAAQLAAMTFLSYIIILNTVVPISLYVSVEIIRVVHSWWINWDEKMYHAKTNTPARSRTTTLNEELGQIEYIFSDKTGTLTQNIMTFNKCTIEGKSYGDLLDQFGNPMDITDRTPKVDFSHNPMSETTFEFYDKRLLDLVMSGDRESHRFFEVLALCHTIMPEIKDGNLEYQAQSPDEGALVSAARNFGFVFKSRTPTTITIEVEGETKVYELLAILDFNNVRKRMSVIVRYKDQIQLLCKGADTTVYERLDPSCADLQEITTSHLNDFAQEGLRTLCLAYKDISPAYWEEWKVKHHAASTALTDREDQLDAVYEEIEQNMILIGATAIEDKLQDGVPEAIANLAKAGIKIWVLTGDKQETAINIGYSCQLLTDEMEEMYVVDGDTYEVVEDQLRKARDEMKQICQTGMRQTDIEVISYANGVSQSSNRGAPMRAEQLGFAIIINGHSLVHALLPKMERLLLETGCMCKAVICCRVTPLQKALVVDLVKRHKKSITLAIGDGANDVSMIKTAHIGIGISGQEGLQAVLSSDFSIAQFRFVERLLLVHGRWSYLRMCKFLKYFFYKNFAFTLCHFWFAFFCGFSAQTLFDPSYISLYNVCYTSLPVLIMASFEQDVNDEYSLKYPRLYTPGHLDLLFNKKVFAQSVGEGIISSMVLFFIPYGAFHDAVRPDGTDMAGHQQFGVAVASILLVAVTLRCALDTQYWTGLNHFVIWGSLIFFFGFTFIFYSDSFGYSYLGTARNIMSTGTFWFTLVLATTVLLVPVVAERFYYIDTRPTLSDKVRVKQKITASQSKSGELILRRRSTIRQSTRSLRSGYAFAHQEGYGELITTGRNMRQPEDQNGNPSKAGRQSPRKSPPKSPDMNHRETVTEHL